MGGEEAAVASSNAPKNAVVVLLDSLNRHMLGAYGGAEFATPNLDRFARPRHALHKAFHGSLPCMPARHDILCGALDFLWRPWGSVEIWEDAITYELRKAGVVTQLISDHRIFRDRRRKLPHRFHRLGLPARSRGRSLEDGRRPKLGRRAELHAQAHAL